MNTKMIIELIGYLGSSLVVVSMLMTSVVRLRVINMIGSIIFTCYALMIKSYPTAAMNLFLVGINIYHLMRLRKESHHYDMIKSDIRDHYVTYLLDKNMEDIKKWFPEFDLRGKKPDATYLVCCDSNPAGILLAKTRNSNELEVILDYATPVYRDTSEGQFLHEALKKEGVRKLVFTGNAPDHEPYMKKVGYTKNSKGEFEKNL